MSVPTPVVMLLFLFYGNLIADIISSTTVMIDLNVIKVFIFIKIIKGIEAIDWYNNYKYNVRIS
jgi:hypothetical protein